MEYVLPCRSLCLLCTSLWYFSFTPLVWVISFPCNSRCWQGWDLPGFIPRLSACDGTSCCHPVQWWVSTHGSFRFGLWLICKMALKKSRKCFRLSELLGQPKMVVVFMQCQFFTSESHQLALDIFGLGDRRKRLIKNILILFEFFILSIFSTGYFNVQAPSHSSNTFRIYLG